MLGTAGGLKHMLKHNPPPSGAPAGVRFEQRIGIRAPASQIWAHLIDFDSWPHWTEIYDQVSGSFQYGGRMRLIQTLPGVPPRQIDAKIIDWEPDAQIIWRDRPMVGVFTTRYLEITTLSDSGSIFTTGEIVSGLLAPWWLKPRGAALRTAMQEQAERMKARVEA